MHNQLSRQKRACCLIVAMTTVLGFVVNGASLQTSNSIMRRLHFMLFLFLENVGKKEISKELITVKCR